MSDSEKPDWIESLHPAPKDHDFVKGQILRNHGVDLERVQRIHLSLDSEEMTFTNETLAAMLEDVAANCDEGDAFILRAVINALLGLDRHHVLTLKLKRKGKFVSPHEHELMSNRNKKWLWWLAKLETGGMKTEAAIMTIAEAEKVSRATVFGGIREAETFLNTGKQIFPDSSAFDNPRLGKTGKA